MTLPSKVLRIFLADALVTVFPMETWLSPAITTRLFFLTEIMVVINLFKIITKKLTNLIRNKIH